MHLELDPFPGDEIDDLADELRRVLRDVREVAEDQDRIRAAATEVAPELASYAHYARQLGVPFAPGYVAETLIEHPDAAQALVRLFAARFDPAADPARYPEALAEVTAADRRGTRPGRRPDPAWLPVRDHRNHPHELLPQPPPPLVQDRARGPPRDAGTPSPVRALRLLAEGAQSPPAVRAGGPRRVALVGPAAGLPHRDPRAGHGTGGEERGDRAGRGQGRVRGHRTRPPGRGRRLLPDVRLRPARRHRQPARRPRRAATGRGTPRRRRQLPGGRRRQGHRPDVRPDQPDLGGVRVLARGRVRLRRVGRLRPQGNGDHRARGVGERHPALPRGRPRHTASGHGADGTGAPADLATWRPRTSPSCTSRCPTGSATSSHGGSPDPPSIRAPAPAPGDVYSPSPPSPPSAWPPSAWPPST